jgi:hypothetical protein
MSPFDGPLSFGPQAVHGRNAQLAAANRVTTHRILMACFSRIFQIRETSFTSRVAFKQAILKFKKLPANLSLDLTHHLK